MQRHCYPWWHWSETQHAQGPWLSGEGACPGCSAGWPTFTKPTRLLAAQVLVIPTDEQLEIAQQAIEVVRRHRQDAARA